MPLPIALAIGGSALLGAGSSIFGASTEAGAANSAAQLELQMFNKEQQNLAPYISAGSGAIPGEINVLQTLGQGFNPQNLQNTPGYQFQLQQGEQALIDQRTATGGVGGGNTLKALDQYGQGLASTTFQQQFQDWLAQNQATLAGYQNLVGTGESAAAGVGAAGLNAANQAGNFLTQAGSATAAGASGVTNSLNNASQNYLLYNLINSGAGSGAAASGGNAFAPGL